MSETDDDKVPPVSGSRWEPPAGGTPAGRPRTTEGPAEHAAAPAEWVRPAREPRRARRGSLAAMGVGLVLAGGLGGFAVGHAAAVTGTEVSDSGAVTDLDEDGVPGGVPGGGRPDFDQDGDGEGAPADGALPFGTAPDDTSPGADDGDSA